MADEKDKRALNLFIGAATLEQIRDQLGYRSTAQAEAAIRRALAKTERDRNKFDQRAVEVERIDALYQQAYVKAVSKNTEPADALKATETCMKLADQRMRLLGEEGPASGITAAFEQSLDALDLTDADLAVIEAGRATAKQIDGALEHGTSYERTKALYLLPHLMNVLKELGATPAARASIRSLMGSKKASGTSKLEALQAGVGLKLAR